MNGHQEALQKLATIGQQHLLMHWNELSDAQKKKLLAQIKHLNLETFKRQQNQLLGQTDKTFQDILPFTTPSCSGNDKDILLGKKMIKDGLVGCLIVAGGQGTRLGVNGPKGAFPVTPIKQKSLFQLFAEKVAAAGRQAGRLLPLAIMTSPLNHQETIDFFHSHNFFGLSPEQVSFFSQGMLPLLDRDGNLFLESKDCIAVGPDGNGLSLIHFYQSGVFAKWYGQGVRVLNFIVIDNPLADPFDAELFGFHQRCKNAVTIKCIKRETVEEKVGVLAEKNGQLVVIEYSEIPIHLAEAKGEDGLPLFSYANISLFCFSLDFIKNAVLSHVSIPLHPAFKAATLLGDLGEPRQSKGPIAWKFETFIFDWFSQINEIENGGNQNEKIQALLFPREQCFAPLKNSKGKNSLITVQQALQENDRRVLSKLSGFCQNIKPVEIAQDFHYPTEEFINNWINKKPLPLSGYIE